MDIMGRRVLRLVAIGAIAIAIPQLASAMGPTSAAQKNQNPATSSDTTVANCSLSEGICAKPHQYYRLGRNKSKRTASAAQFR
jgi:hypothetical protein